MNIFTYGIQICNMIKSISVLYNIKSEIVYYGTDCTELINKLKEIKRLKSTNLYIIKLKSEEDIKVAEEIRKHDYSGNIVFVSASEKYALRVIKSNVKALDYIVPCDDFRDRIKKILIDSYKKGIAMKDKPSFFTIKDGYSTVKVPFQEINFIETLNRRIYLYTDSDRYEFTGTITDLNSQLQSEADYFFCCHRAYIINLNKVREIGKELLYIGENRIDIPLSRLKRKELLNMVMGV